MRHVSNASFIEAALDSVPQMIWRAGPDGSCTFLNRRWCDFTGQDRSGDISSKWVEALHPEDAERVHQAWLAAAQLQTDFEGRFRLRHVSGEYRWVLSVATAERHEEQVLSWCGTCTDIHDEVAADEARAEAERKLATTLNLIPHVVWSAGPDGVPDFVNSYWSEVHGTDISAAIGTGWVEATHPDDREHSYRSWISSVASGEPHEAKFRMLAATGEYRWTHVHVVPERNSTGEIVRWHGTCTDVHEQVLSEQALRESEENYRYTLDLSPQIPWTADPQGNVLQVGPLWSELIGTTPEEATGLGSASAIHPDDVDESLKKWAHSVKTGAPLDSVIRLKLKDGSYNWFRTRAAARRDNSGAIVRWYGVIENIHEQVIAQLELKESEENYRHTVELSPQIPWTADPQGSILEAGPRWLELMGMTREETLGQGWAAALHPDDLDATQSAWTHSLRTGEPVDMRYRLKLESGDYSWFRVRAAARRRDSGEITRWYGLAENIQEQVEAEIRLIRKQQELIRSEEQSRLIARATNDLLWDWDTQTETVTCNEVLSTRYGHSPDQLKTSRNWWAEQIHPQDRVAILKDLDLCLRGKGDRYLGEYRFRRADATYACVYNRGYVVRDESGIPLRMVGAIQDLTDRKRAEEQLRWSATHDTLTELPNRHLFQERLKGALNAAQREGHNVGILHLDIDHFKQVNDTLGHDAGDTLLRIFAERLSASVRSSDTVARLGGDELAIILSNVTDAQDIPALVRLIQDRLREPFVYQGRILDCRASVGVSIFPQHGTSPDELLQNADIALYAAKTAGRGGFMVFEAGQRDDLQQRSSMINIARDAIADNRIVPFYQPKIELDSGRVAGFEALLRWRDGRGRLQLPQTIAAAFDDLDVAADISDRIIDQAIADMRRWLDRGVDFGHIAVNASAAEFRRDHFAERVLERLRRAGIPPKHFEIEVTETVFLGRGSDYVERALRLLSSEGVRVALDDFGTGYASLRHLKQFPVNILKIDHSFVRDMNDDASDAAIIRAVIGLGESLGVDVVAEGVETEAQAGALREMGCRYVQGYLYSRAVSARQVPKILQLDAFHMSTRSAFGRS